MRTCFVCSPFRGKDATERARNVKVAKDLCLDAVRKGFAPLAPHLFFPGFLDEDVVEERLQGIAAGTEWLSRCDEVWVFDLNGISAGMTFEIEAAHNLNIPVRYPWSPDSWSLDADL
jgi:hypothetical protein